MNERRNAVIGTAAGYSVDQIRNFVLSFREHNTVDRIIFITDVETKPFINEFANEHGVELVVLSCFRFVETFVNNIRWFGIYDYLINNGVDQFKSILLCDVKDAIFQSDPFENLPDQFLYYFTEDTGIPIKDQEINAGWMKTIYNQEVYEQVCERYILCLGTIMGTGNLILNYVKFVYSELLRLKYNNPNVFKGHVLDQAFGIYAAYLMYADIAVVKLNGDIVGTCSLSIQYPNQRKDVVTLHMGKIFVNGKAPAIVHQYDRSSLLLDFINKKYMTDVVIIQPPST